MEEQAKQGRWRWIIVVVVVLVLAVAGIILAINLGNSAKKVAETSNENSLVNEAENKDEKATENKEESKPVANAEPVATELPKSGMDDGLIFILLAGALGYGVAFFAKKQVAA